MPLLQIELTWIIQGATAMNDHTDTLYLGDADPGDQMEYLGSFGS